jgi:hypothetical protein
MKTRKSEAATATRKGSKPVVTIAVPPPMADAIQAVCEVRKCTPEEYVEEIAGEKVRRLFAKLRTEDEQRVGVEATKCAEFAGVIELIAYLQRGFEPGGNLGGNLDEETRKDLAGMFADLKCQVWDMRPVLSPDIALGMVRGEW